MKRASFIVLAGLSACANAAGWGGLKNLSQSEFRDVAGDLGAAFSYKALSPGDPLGITGFDVGVEAGLSKVQAARAFDKATGWNASFLPVTRLHAHKGLPFDFDIGFSLARVPGLDASLTGAEARWAPLDGSMLLPALSVRGTYSRLAGVNELDFRAYGLEASLSKGFLIFKPYLGVGYVRSKSSPSVGGLDEVSLGQSKRFAGVNVNLGLVNYAVELDRTGETMTYGLKAGLRF